MSGDRSRRVRKIEDRRRSHLFVPHVIMQRCDEERGAAIAQFRKQYGDAIPNRHAVLIVPTWPTFDAFAADLKAQQLGLAEWVRAHHPKEPAPC